MQIGHPDHTAYRTNDSDRCTNDALMSLDDSLMSLDDSLKPSPTPPLPLPQGELTARHFLREKRKRAHTGVRPAQQKPTSGTRKRAHTGVCPAQQKPTSGTRKRAHTGVRPYQIALPVGADPRVCPAQQKPTSGTSTKNCRAVSTRRGRECNFPLLAGEGTGVRAFLGSPR